MAMGRAEFERYCRPEWRDWAIEAWRAAVADSNNSDYYPPAARRIHTPSLIAQIRNVHATYHADRLVLDGSVAGIVPRERGGRSFYLVGDRVVLAFKKLDPELRPCGWPTGQNSSFLDQLPLPGLETVERATNIIAGYTVNELDAGLRIFFTCPLGERNLWVWELWSEEDGLRLFDSVPPTAPIVSPATERRLRLVRPKRAEGERRATDGASE